MTPKDLRFFVAVAFFGFLFVLFVPVIYDGSLFQCTSRGVLCLSNPSGLKSIGYTLLHWGGFSSFGGGGDPQLSGYGFVNPGLAYADGSTPTTSAILVFFALPLAIAGAGLLEPEIIRKIRATVIGYMILGLFALIVASGFFAFAYHGFGLAFDLLGVAVSLMGTAIILYLYGTGCLNRTLRPDPNLVFLNEETKDPLVS